MIKSVIERRRIVYHKHQWLRLLTLSCGHHVLVLPYLKVSQADCQKCKGKAKNWRME